MCYYIHKSMRYVTLRGETCIFHRFVIASKCECTKTARGYVSLSDASYIPNQSMVICLLADSYLKARMNKHGVENIPNCCFRVELITAVWCRRDPVLA